MTCERITGHFFCNFVLPHRFDWETHQIYMKHRVSFTFQWRATPFRG